MSLSQPPLLRMRVLAIGTLWSPSPSWVDPRLVSYQTGLQIAPRKFRMGPAYSPLPLLARLGQLCSAVHALHAHHVQIIF